MNIIITDSSLRKFLETPAKAETLSQNLSLCGPTFDQVTKIGDDFVYHIEVITNRVDTASAQGVAREAAAILTQFGIPAKLINDPYQDKPHFKEGLSKQFHFNIEKDLVVRFTAIALENILVKPSPKETQSFLENCGQRSLNNCIDITNELTLLYGIPSHIFDLDKLASQNLHLRESHHGEEITTLDGQKNKLGGGDIVIEDGSGRLVDLCGVMGGSVAEVDNHTKNILLIVPVYEAKRIRKTSLSLQKRTLAAQIYEKQPDPELCLPVISKALQLFKERAGGEVSSSLFDYHPVTHPPKLISLDFNWLNSFVGIEIKRETVISILASLGFSGTLEDNRLVCSVPSWRYHDINIREDLAEEVSRIYGYYRFPSVLPCVNLPSEPKNLLLETELKIKKYLSNIGFFEIYNSSLISHELIKKTSQNSDELLNLLNPLSSEFAFLRNSLLPSLLENHKRNQGKFSEPLRTYEVSNCYQKVRGKELPHEISTLAILSNENYRQAKGKIESLLDYMNVDDISFRPSQFAPPFFSQLATADIYSKDILLGQIGLLKPSLLRNIGLPSNPIAIEINLEKLCSKINEETDIQLVSNYPYMLEDITITSDKPLGELIQDLKSFDPLIREVSYIESYRNKHTFKFFFGSSSRNLDQKEVNSLKGTIQKHFSN